MPSIHRSAVRPKWLPGWIAGCAPSVLNGFTRTALPLITRWRGTVHATSPQAGDAREYKSIQVPAGPADNSRTGCLRFGRHGKLARFMHRSTVLLSYPSRLFEQ